MENSKLKWLSIFLLDVLWSYFFRASLYCLAVVLQPSAWKEKEQWFVPKLTLCMFVCICVCVYAKIVFLVDCETERGQKMSATHVGSYLSIWFKCICSHFPNLEYIPVTFWRPSLFTWSRLHVSFRTGGNGLSQTLLICSVITENELLSNQCHLTDKCANQRCHWWSPAIVRKYAK